MHSLDIYYSILLVSLGVGIAAAYVLRLIFQGRAQYDRIHKHGGSVLLSKGIMEMAYWSLQPIAKGLMWCRITPNQISWASLVLGGMAGTFLAFGQFGTGALCATLSAFFDSLDGIVARQSGIASDAGEVLDAAIDRYVEFFYISGLVFFFRDNPWLLGVCLLALVGSFLVSYSTAKAEALKISPPPGIMRRPERAVYLIAGAALAPFFTPVSLGFFSETAVPLPVAGSLIFVGILSNISAIERLYTIALGARLKAEGKPVPHEVSQGAEALLPEAELAPEVSK